jgi:tubulin polyglutamylase TTLL4
MLPLQRFSHYQGCWQLGRKDFLWMNVQKKRLKFPEWLGFMPLTFCLKNEYEEFLKHKESSEYWIIKPVDAARGEGIFVVTNKEEVQQQKGK